MASNNKYTGLVDVDNAAPEIYETPELTDDASTIQSNTLHTASPTPSEDDGDDRFDRQRIDQDTARRRFEPSIVNAKDANFSDTVAGDRQSYRTRTRRRRRRRYDDDSDGSESDEETLSSKIARLKREAEEVRLQLASRDENKFKETVEEQEGTDGETDGMEELDRLIRGLKPSKITPGKSEDSFLQSLANGQPSKSTTKSPAAEDSTATPSSTIATIAAFSDRLTALEAALGLNTLDLSNSTSTILPTLDTLITQITTLTSTLSPTSKSPAISTTTPPQHLNLDTLSSRIKSLTSDADKLTSSRKAALNSLTDIQEARLRYTRPSYRPDPNIRAANPLKDLNAQEDVIQTDLFLEEQSSKITALYQVLPTVTSLQPLLPVVLERLRSLSVIHAGAANARGELDDVIKRQGEMKRDVQRWRDAVEGVERQMLEMKEGMRENVEVVGGMVAGIEERVKALQKP